MAAYLRVQSRLTYVPIQGLPTCPVKAYLRAHATLSLSTVFAQNWQKHSLNWSAFLSFFLLLLLFYNLFEYFYF